MLADMNVLTTKTKELDARLSSYNKVQITSTKVDCRSCRTKHL